MLDKCWIVVKIWRHEEEREIYKSFPFLSPEHFQHLRLRFSAGWYALVVLLLLITVTDSGPEGSSGLCCVRSCLFRLLAVVKILWQHRHGNAIAELLAVIASVISGTWLTVAA